MALRDNELTVTGPWVSEMEEAVLSGVADRVVLNYALGFDETNLEFLHGLPIRQLVILQPAIDNIEPIYSLGSTLEELRLTVGPAARVDLSRLPALTDLGAEWRQVAQSIGAGRMLRRLWLRSYAETDLYPIASLLDLVCVQMKDRPTVRSLAGLSELPHLQELGIYSARSLEDISDIGTGNKFVRLELEGCRRLKRINEIASCSDLRRLNLSDCGELESAAPLGTLGQLSILRLHGTTKFVDGDLSSIATLPRLSDLRMQDRRHYRPSVSQIKARLAER